MQLFDIDFEWDLASLDDSGKHAEEISVVDHPYLLHYHVPQPRAVFLLFEFSVAHQPLFVGKQTRGLEVATPLVDQAMH